MKFDELGDFSSIFVGLGRFATDYWWFWRVARRFLRNFAWRFGLSGESWAFFFHATYFCQLFSDGKAAARLIMAEG